MPFSRKVCLSLLITFLFCLPFAFGNKLISNNRLKVLHFEGQSGTVPSITARVGEYQISILSGWASPYAEVNLNGQGTARKTMANENGYFEFLFVPVKKSYGELCLTSQDVNLIPTLPVCLPAIPPTENIEIIGVLLPPTISLDKGKIPSGETTKASGMTFPDSDIDVYLFENSRINLIPSVFAMGLPKYSIRSNKNGYYEFSLPAAKPSTNRVFATAKPTLLSLNPPLPSLDPPEAGRQGVVFYSPKSNTLSFSVIKTNYLWLLLILAVILIALTLGKKKNQSLMVVETNILSGPKVLKII